MDFEDSSAWGVVVVASLLLVVGVWLREPVVLHQHCETASCSADDLVHASMAFSNDYAFLVFAIGLLLA
jgi:hypothetical protein